MDQVQPHRYMVYGKEGVFDADRLIDLLRALEAELREEGVQEGCETSRDFASISFFLNRIMEFNWRLVIKTWSLKDYNIDFH